MATHSSILAWRIPWTEEPGGLWPTGSQESEPGGLWPTGSQESEPGGLWPTGSKGRTRLSDRRFHFLLLLASCVALSRVLAFSRLPFGLLLRS